MAEGGGHRLGERTLQHVRWKLTAFATLCLLLLAGCKGGPGDDATKVVVQLAAKCSLVTDRLGSPLSGSWSSYRGRGSVTEVDGRLKGPKGSATFHVEALRSGKTLTPTRCFVVAEGTAIDVLRCSTAGQQSKTTR